MKCGDILQNFIITIIFRFTDYAQWPSQSQLTTQLANLFFSSSNIPLSLWSIIQNFISDKIRFFRVTVSAFNIRMARDLPYLEIPCHGELTSREIKKRCLFVA
jgi:hypothetical protein